MPSPASRAPTSAVEVTSEESSRDRLAAYAAMRNQAAVLWAPGNRGFFVTRYADAFAVLRDSRLSQGYVAADWKKISQKLNRDYSSVVKLFSYIPFVYDGDAHAALRRVFADTVAPYADERACIEARVEQMLNRVRGARGFDVVKDFSGCLMLEVMCDFMNLPPHDRDRLRPIANLSWALDEMLSVRRRDDFARSLQFHIRHLEKAIRDRCDRGGVNMVTRLMQALPPETEDRIGATTQILVIMLLMGNDAVGACISFAVRHLLSADADKRLPQSQWAELSDDAVRYAAPVDPLTRIADRDVEIAGCPVAKGERLIVSPLCANHDQSHFGDLAGSIAANPSRGVGLAFGAGRHVCVGNRLSRAIVKAAFGGLAKLPPMNLSGPSAFGDGKVVRTLSSLPVEFQQ